MPESNIFSLTGLQGQVKDIARPYMFKMSVGEKEDKPLMTATLRTANLPGLAIQEVAVNYFGMVYKVAGTPSYEPLTCTILVDGDYQSRKLWNEYMAGIFKYTDDGPSWIKPADYMKKVFLYGLKPNDRTAAITYTLEMCWISAIAALPMSQDNVNATLTFDATITYSYYTTDKGVTFA